MRGNTVRAAIISIPTQPINRGDRDRGDTIILTKMPTDPIFERLFLIQSPTKKQPALPRSVLEFARERNC